ncbi:hypothetical protein JX265_002405 [Neoarthrinium moseri]|uniref:Histone-lysine N-methyltransferase, H3 lysine-79 specific n=1 Tax=Neoarthrinium moseri TaxID=1658444 RepID=A0A9P9WUF9_9PEZI|nr:hypothetical protein JX266_000886 [Neoarthrinium moseri]KAI1879451.1 hypothetical protein JX265_002405 [Neoarthrinium moseri]
MPLLKAKSATQSVRVEKVVVKKAVKKVTAPTPRSSLAPNGSLRATSDASSSSPRLLSPNSRAVARTKSASPYPSSSDERAGRKRTLTQRRQNTPRDSPHFGPDDSDDDDDEDPFAKKRKVISTWRDPHRRLRHKKAFGDDIRSPNIIHGADLASVKTGCPPAFGAPEDEKDRIDAVKDIKQVVKHVAETYLTEEQAQPFIDHNSSFYRDLEKAANEKRCDVPAFKAALNSYNTSLLSLVEDGSVAKNLDNMHGIPPSLVDFILTQVYERTVSPNVDSLNKYQPGGDNVYGELNAPFVREILQVHGGLTSEKVFIDLGSGVGNVVLQAALEIGCRSYGCEMVENSCNFAEAQEKEFNARCLLWGIGPGRVRLERGDFRTNKKILEVLKEADCILVNNKAFTPALNAALVSMFLDLKPGCKVVSLVSFILGNEKNAINDIANNIFEVVEDTYKEDWVSWSRAPGRYFVSTRK